MRRGPVRFVAVDVPFDLRRPLTKRPHEGRELHDLPHPIQAEPVRRESGAELRVGGHRGMSDPVDRTQRVADTDGVQATPLTGSERPRVDQTPVLRRQAL